MLERGKISPWQAMGLMISFVLGGAILLIPPDLANTARQDAWLSLIFAILGGMGIILFYINLGLKFPEKNIIQYSEIILGKYIGKIAGLFLIWFALHLGSLVVLDFGQFMSATILPDTPVMVINGLIVLLAVLAVRQGLEVFARVNSFLLPAVIFLILVLVFLAIPNMDFRRLQPVMENGVMPVFKGALSAISFPFLETIVFTMLIPYINEPERAKKPIILGGLAGGFLLLLVLLRTLLVLGPIDTARLWFPTLEAVRMINIFYFIQRIEAVVIINWICFGFIEVTICFYAFVLGLAQWLNLKDYKPLVLPAGVIMLSLSTFLYKSWIEAVATVRITIPYKFFIALAIPLTLILVATIRGMGKRN